MKSIKKFVAQHLIDNGWEQHETYKHQFTQEFKTIFVDELTISLFFKGHHLGEISNTKLLATTNMFLRYFIEGNNIEEKETNPFD